MTSEEAKRLEEKARRRAAEMGGLLAILAAASAGRLKSRVGLTRGILSVDSRPVGVKALRDELARVEDSLAKRLDLYAARLESGEWTVDRWADETASLLEDQHTLFGALALGSLALAAASPVAESRRDTDLRYAEKFKKDVKAGRVKGPRLRRRSRSYLPAARVTFAMLEKAVRRAAGYREARRMVRKAEHCRTDDYGLIGCLEAALLGWRPIDEVEPIGSLPCRQYCKCYLIYR